MGPRKLQIFKSLNRQNLILGCERELVLVVALFSAALVFIGQSFSTLLIGIFIWGLSLYFLRKMAKIDPKMSRIFKGHVRHITFYSARSKIWRRH